MVSVSVSSFAAEYYSRLPEGAFGRFVREPERREWAFTVERGGELVFVRRKKWDEVKGFVELYHSMGYFEEPTRWEGLTGWDLIIDVDVDLANDDSESLEEIVDQAGEAAEELREAAEVFLGRPDVVNFSGAKGFHLRWMDVPIPDTVTDIDPDTVARASRKLVQAIVDYAGEEYEDYVDLQIYQVNRLIRVVGSLNAKTLLPAVPVDDPSFEGVVDGLPEAWWEAAERVCPSLPQFLGVDR